MGNARQEIARAEAALRAAHVLLNAGMWADATSRAYYAAFHASHALPIRLGVQARSHSGLRSLIAVKLVESPEVSEDRDRRRAPVLILHPPRPFSTSRTLAPE